MNPVEPLVLGGLCAARALREARRPLLVLTALVPFACQVLAVIAIAFVAHPALSWALAPLVRALAGEEALRYPELFRRLPQLAARAQLAVGVLIAPLAAGAATRLFDDVFRGRPARPVAAAREALSRAPALVVAVLPAILGTLAVEAGLGALAGVRVSGLSRQAAPAIAVLLVLVLRAACFYAVALVVFERRGPLGVLAGLPGTWPRGFLPALVASALLALPLAPFARLEAWGAGPGGRDWPEVSALVAIVRAAAEAAVALVAAGAAALAWRGAGVPGETDA